jgi:WD40 repeat protein
MKTKLLLVTFSLMLIVGCSSRGQPSFSTEVNQYQDQMTLTPTIVPETFDPFTPTLVIPTEIHVPIRNCENDGFPIVSLEDMAASGEVLLRSSDQNRLDALDLETQVISTIYHDENSELSIFGSSPNGKWLAYAIRTYDSNGDVAEEFKLELISETGEKIGYQMDVSKFKDLFMGDIFVGFGSSYWLNNDLIYTTLLVQNVSEFGSKTPSSFPVILDPFAGTWEHSLLSLQPEWNGQTEIGFSPDLQSVVLQSGREIKLKDLKNGSYLWSTDDFFLEIPDSKIRWSPNGNFIAAGNRFPNPEILLVSADGEKSEIISVGNIEGFLDFEWSPNGQFLMMYHSYGDDQKQFYLYDMAKQQIVLTCPVQQPWDILFQWSPDSTQVIYGSHEGYLQVLDIPSGGVASLEVEDVLPFSWTYESFVH